MQFIETSIMGVRSAVLTFRRSRSRPTFLLVPMAHIAERSFYDQVAERLRGCDLIVAEGRPNAETVLHRKMARIRFDGLVHQTVALDLETLGVSLLWPDRGWNGGSTRWSTVVGDVLTAVPDWVATLKFPSDGMDITDLTGHDGWREGRVRRAWRKSVLHDRDRLLLDRLGEVHRERRGARITVGVPWGALHMTAVAGYLYSELGYRVTAAEWLTIRDAR
ncbi:hypothetical protein ACFYSC_06460 [Streptosporangium sp. NPDC004379]|uniref:hypothetical protein n=1 Tax=Streptosporangium sp. NPDC004379 TaxID=3366189 RepID=UPI00369E1B97